MNTRTVKKAAMALMPAALLALNSCSSSPNTLATAYQPPPPTPPPTGPVFIGGGVAASSASGMVSVESVDTSKRTLLLRRVDGTAATYQAGPEAVNFDRIKAGDQLMTTATENFVVYLVPPGVPPSSVTNTVVSGKPKGSQPGGVIIRTIDYNAKVLAVDYATRRVLLQYGTNSAKSVVASPGVNLMAVKVNDDVLIRSTEAIAVAVVP